MGLEVAEFSELPALRPIQTAAVSGAPATVDDEADTGCVTPTARATAGEAKDDAATDGIGSATPSATGPMAALPQPDGGADDASYATPTTCRTTLPLYGAAAAAGDATAASFTTPTCARHNTPLWSALRPATVCPPAPRKLPPALKRKLAPLQQRLFYPVPRDLATVFMPAPPPAAKKMRAHAVESSLPLGT